MAVMGSPEEQVRMQTFRAAISLKSEGFTLLELLIVILVIGIFITFASVNWNILSKKGKDALLERFSISIAMIREEAVSDYENKVVEFDVGAGKIRVGSMDVKNTFLETGEIDLSEGYRIKDVSINGRPCPTGKCYMTFRADGTVDRVILHFEGHDENELYSLLVNPLTAKVTGENGYTEETSFRDRNNSY
jgi:prepilin-type N-terminal cleavage/methylation domain-containing protein